MSTFTHTCPVCGAEEGLEVILARSVDDDETRQLIAEVIRTGTPLGAQVVRYLSLHKPPKQRLRVTKVRELLRELVPDIQRGAIKRAGREWAVPPAAWRAGFEAVHQAHEQGSLTPPLEGLGYLYAVLMRQADRSEAREEQANQHGHKVGTSRLRPEVAIFDDPALAPTGPLQQQPPQQPPPPTPAQTEAGTPRSIAGPTPSAALAVQRLRDIKTAMTTLNPGCSAAGAATTTPKGQ